jgi:hypothetical protein
MYWRQLGGDEWEYPYEGKGPAPRPIEDVQLPAPKERPEPTVNKHNNAEVDGG